MGDQPLPGPVRDYFEPRFGRDFGDVRVHADARAADTAKSIGAKAFTRGKDVVFGAGQYSPVTWEGRRLLGHELVHVVQQRFKSNNCIIQRNRGFVSVKKKKDEVIRKYLAYKKYIEKLRLKSESIVYFKKNIVEYYKYSKLYLKKWRAYVHKKPFLALQLAKDALEEAFESFKDAYRAFEKTYQIKLHQPKLGRNDFIIKNLLNTARVLQNHPLFRIIHRPYPAKFINNKLINACNYIYIKGSKKYNVCILIHKKMKSDCYNAVRLTQSTISNAKNVIKSSIQNIKKARPFKRSKAIRIWKWDWVTLKAIEEFGKKLVNSNPKDMYLFCPKYTGLNKFLKKVFWVNLIAWMAYFESRLDPNWKTGNNFGLLQISLNVTRQSRYGCKSEIKNESDLKNPVKNIRCGIKMLNYLVGRHNQIGNRSINIRIRGGKKRIYKCRYTGGSRYWAVLRISKKKGKWRYFYKNIYNQTRKLSFCK